MTAITRRGPAGEPTLIARGEIDPGTAAWLVAIPCAVVVVGAVLALGPPLADLLFPARPPFTFLSHTGVAPEPVEQSRYLIALTAPLLLALGTVAVVRRGGGRGMAPVAALAQLLAIVVLVACLVGQHRRVFQHVYFTASTWAVAAALAALLLIVARWPRVRVRCVALMRDTPGRRIAVLLLAASATAIWVLPAINSSTSIAWSADTYDAAFQFDEAFAVLNGLTPLVDFSPQYGSLVPFAEAAVMAVFGKTLLVFTILMAATSALAMLAIFGVLRRAAGSALAALLLYLPFLATSFFFMRGTLLVRFSFGTYFPMFPLRYGGAYLLAWLTARHLDGQRRAPRWTLFLIAGLVAVNNTDFGIPAFGATITAIVWTRASWSRPALARLARTVGLGLLAALALVAALTLVRAGELPHPARLVAYARIYVTGGFGLLPLPSVIGLPLVIFLTYVAAIGVATARAIGREPNRVLTGMLAWVGVFGLGAASYYVSRTDPETLQTTFSAWTLALALLTIVSLRHLAATPARRMSAVACVALLGIGVAACSVVQVPMPWQQIARIQHRPAGRPLIPVDYPYVAPRAAAVRRFVSSIAAGRHRFVVVPGAPVALFGTTGHMLADAYGLRDVVPFTGIESLHTAEQLDEAIAALRRAGGNTVLIPPYGEAVYYRALADRGFEMLTRSGLQRAPGDGQIGGVKNRVIVADMVKWVDARSLHPAAAPRRPS
jgi:hypothetical protein